MFVASPLCANYDHLVAAFTIAKEELMRRELALAGDFSRELNVSLQKSSIYTVFSLI